MKHLRILSALVFLLLTACTSPVTPQSPTLISNTPEVNIPTPTTTEELPPTPEATPTPQPTTLTITANPLLLSSDSVIVIRGFFPNPPEANEINEKSEFQFARVCWQDCEDALVYENQPVEWQGDEPGVFEIKLIPPLSGWMTPQGPQSLQSGEYTIGIQCLGNPDYNCINEPPQVTTTIQVDASGVESPVYSFSSLSSTASPGSYIKFTGTIPMVHIYGDIQSSLDLVVIQSDGTPGDTLGQLQQNLDGTLTGSLIFPAFLPSTGTLQPGELTLGVVGYLAGGLQVIPATTRITILPSTSWQQLFLGPPLRIEPSLSLSESYFAIDSQRNGRVAYCSPGEIFLTEDNGQNWIPLSTTSVKSAIPNGYVLMNPDNPTCMWLTLDSANPNSMYAAFPVARVDVGAPPEYFMAFSTFDRGTTWRAIPAPAPELSENFGGFITSDNNVFAMYYKPGSSPDQPIILFQKTTDGGKAWNPGTPPCPLESTCLRWGPGTGSISGMGSPAPQYLIHSQDNGKTWQATYRPLETRQAGVNQLVYFAGRKILLISPYGDFPLLYSGDGGENWEYIKLPPLDGTDVYGYPGLQMLNDGSLITWNGQVWLRLVSGSDSWCNLTGLPLPLQPTYTQVSGDRIWWLLPNAEPPSPNHAPASGVGCSP